MSHSGNQGPDWFFSIFGRQSRNAGVARFVIILALLFVIAATLMWYFKG
jgi:hypothetical protein